MDKWCKFNPHKIYKDENYKKIINFYIWSCPAPKTTYDSKTFKELGWEKPHQFKKLKKKIIANCNMNFIYANVKDIKKTLTENNQLNKKTFKEIVIIFGAEKGEMDSLFRSIRNSLAHGSFYIEKKHNDYFYFFESRNPNNNIIKSRIVLKSSTLVSLIKIVSNGPLV